jgi:hypothetical protein
MEAAHMEEPTKDDTLRYVADMADQLAVMCKEHDPPTEGHLRKASAAARAAIEDTSQAA